MPVNRLTTLLPWLFLLGAGGTQGAGLACGDFLSRLGKKPAYLAYQGCQQNRERQDQPFEARYAVDGKHARQAEAYLRHTVRTRDTWPQIARFVVQVDGYAQDP